MELKQTSQGGVWVKTEPILFNSAFPSLGLKERILQLYIPIKELECYETKELLRRLFPNAGQRIPTISRYEYPHLYKALQTVLNLVDDLNFGRTRKEVVIDRSFISTNTITNDRYIGLQILFSGPEIATEFISCHLGVTPN